MSTRDLERLAKAVKTARLALHPSRLAAAKAAGMSKDTWQRVEEGMEVRDGTYAKIEKVLNWPAGECLAIAEGTGPSTPDSSDDDPRVTVLAPEEVDESVRNIVQLAAIATAPDMTGKQIKELSDRIARDLRELGKL